MTTVRLIVLILSISFLVACGEETGSKSAEDHTTEEIITTIKGGRTGGAWSVFTEGIAESIRREVDQAYITVEPGSIIENPPMVGTGTLPYGLSYAMTAYAAYTGNEPYPERFDSLRAVSVIIPANYFQFVAVDGLIPSSLKDVVTSRYPLRLGVNQKGSDAERIIRELFLYYGVTYEDIISWGGSVDYVSAAKAYEMMADGRLDAFGNAESAPSSTILEASTTTDLKMIELEDEALNAVASDLGMNTNTIDASLYSFLKEDIKTVSTPAILITHKDAPDEEVYAITKSIYHSLDYLRTVHSEFKDLTKQKMKEVGEIPLHPGAAQFFKEKGLMND